MAIREINLIDPDILVRRHVRRHLFCWAAGLLVCLAMLGGLYLFQSHAAAAQRTHRGSLEQLHTNLQTQVEEIMAIQARLEKLKNRRVTIEAVTKKPHLHQMLVQLADIINEHTWVTHLAVDAGPDPAAGIHLRLTGFSRSNEDLGDFINRLSTEPIFKAVVLQFSKESDTAQAIPDAGQSAQRVQFQITCTMGGG